MTTTRIENASRRGFLQGGHQKRAGIAVKFFGHFDLGEQGVKLIAFAGAVGPGFRGIHQEVPVIGSRTGA